MRKDLLPTLDAFWWAAIFVNVLMYQIERVPKNHATAARPLQIPGSHAQSSVPLTVYHVSCEQAE